MENLKPTQSLEQKQETPEDYVVATFPVDIDPDNARRPLTVIRSGQDGEGVKYDRGWNPIGMSVVCGTDSEEGIGPIKLLMEAYKLVGTDIKTEFVPLEDIQDLNEDYIKYLYGKTPKEMIEEGKRAAEQKYPVGSEIESLAPEVGSDSGAETPSNGLVEDNTSDHEKSLAAKVGPAMGGVAVKATGIEKPAKIDKVDANPADLAATEPAKKPVETGRVSISPSTLVMSKKVLESIGAVKVDDSVGSPAIKSAAVKELAKNLAVASAKELVVDSIKNPAVKLAKKPAKIDKVDANPADLVATEPVEKPVEADKASTDSVNLPAAKLVENPVAEKPMETNETNADILPESFKDAINRFKQLAEENNGKFFAKAQYIAGKLDQLRQQIQINPAVIYGLDSEGLLTAESSIIRNLEDSRAEDANKFKNDINSLLEGLESKIGNDNERRRLDELTKHVGRMGKDNVVLGNVTNGLLDKLIRIRSNIAESQSGSWGIDDYKSSITRVIDEIINDLSIASGCRRGIVGGIEGIKREGYCQKR